MQHQYLMHRLLCDVKNDKFYIGFTIAFAVNKHYLNVGNTKMYSLRLISQITSY